MNMFIRTALTASVLLLARPALAAERTVTLAVENVGCVTCAPIVKRTLSRMPGVSRVVVAELNGAAAATVTFDDGQIMPDAMATAVTNAGFPTHVQVN